MALDSKGSHSPSSSTSDSATLPPKLPVPPLSNPNPPPKKRGREHLDDRQRPWPTKAAKNQLAQHPPNTYSDDDDKSLEEEEDSKDGGEGSEHFSNTEDQE